MKFKLDLYFDISFCHIKRIYYGKPRQIIETMATDMKMIEITFKEFYVFNNKVFSNLKIFFNNSKYMYNIKKNVYEKTTI